MWIISIIPLILTGITIQFMPDSVPMHYDISGKIDDSVKGPMKKRVKRKRLI